jgi:hypothetical protein
MRPRASLAAKNGVGELAARESGAPNAGDRERERGDMVVGIVLILSVIISSRGTRMKGVDVT